MNNNRVFLQGNLGQDAELKTFDNGGGQLVKLRLATTERRGKGDDAQEHTDWHSVTVRSGRGDTLRAATLTKGTNIQVWGSIHYREVVQDDGSKTYFTDIKCWDSDWSYGFPKRLSPEGVDVHDDSTGQDALPF